MPLAIRPYRPDDGPAAVALANLTRTAPMSLERWRELEENSPEQFRLRLIAELDGRPVGYAAITAPPWLTRGTLLLQIVVEPHLRRQGIGRRLFAAVDPALRRMAPAKVQAAVCDNDPDSYQWIQRRGFRFLPEAPEPGQWWLERDLPGRPVKQWTVLGGFLMLLANFGVQLVVGLIIGLVLAFSMMGGSPSPTMEQWLMPMILSGTMGGSLLLLLTQVRRKGSLPLWKSQELRDIRGWGWAFLALLVVFGANVLRILLQPNLDVPEINQELLNLVGHARGGFPWAPVAVIWVSTIIGAPLAEEWLFRGIVQRTLTVKWGPWVGIPVTSVIFGLFHGFSMWWVASVYGLAFGYLAHRRQSLTFPMLVHGTLNLAVMLLTTLSAQ